MAHALPAAFCLALALGACPAFAQSPRAKPSAPPPARTVPLPPPRPPEFGRAPAQPLPGEAPAPEDGPTGGLPSPAGEPGLETTGAFRAQPLEGAQQPSQGAGARDNLYDRSAMRACGQEWAQMKREGATAGVIWRDFAAQCLPRRQKQMR